MTSLPPTHGLDLATHETVHEAWLEFFRLCREMAQSARQQRNLQEEISSLQDAELGGLSDWEQMPSREVPVPIE